MTCISYPVVFFSRLFTSSFFMNLQGKSMGSSTIGMFLTNTTPHAVAVTAKTMCKKCTNDVSKLQILGDIAKLAHLYKQKNRWLNMTFTKLLHDIISSNIHHWSHWPYASQNVHHRKVPKHWSFACLVPLVDKDSLNPKSSRPWQASNQMDLWLLPCHLP